MVSRHAAIDDGVTWTAGFEPLDGVTTCCYRGQSWPSSKGVNLVCDDDGVGHVVVNGVDIDPNPIISYNDLIDRPIVDGKLQYSIDGTDQGIKNLRTLTGWDAELSTLRIKSNGGDMPFHIFSSSGGSAGFGTKDANEGRGSYAMSFHIDPDATISDNNHRILIESKKLEVRPNTSTVISGHGVMMTGSVSQQNAVMVLNHYKNEMGVNETFTPFMEIAGRENGASTIKYLFGDGNGQFMTTSFIDEASGYGRSMLLTGLMINYDGSASDAVGLIADPRRNIISLGSKSDLVNGGGASYNTSTKTLSVDNIETHMTATMNELMVTGDAVLQSKMSVHGETELGKLSVRMEGDDGR